MADPARKELKPPRPRKKKPTRKARGARVRSRRRAAPRKPRKTKASKPRRYSDQERRRILATARREGLTGAQVHQRFGISTLTYYLWRKKAGAGNRGPARTKRTHRAPIRDGALAAQVRQEVQAKVGEILPQILREEVAAYVGQALGGRRR
jgi:transposase-like protein